MNSQKYSRKYICTTHELIRSNTKHENEAIEKLAPPTCTVGRDR